MCQSIFDHKKKKKKIEKSKKHTIVLIVVKNDPHRQLMVNMKEKAILGGCNLQISHNVEKKHIAVKGGHSKISKVQNRHAPPPKHILV